VGKLYHTKDNHSYKVCIWSYILRIVFVHLQRSLYSENAKQLPVTVTSLSEAWTVFAHFNAGIVGSNPTQSMDVCVYKAALQRADPPSKESYRLYVELKNWKNDQGPIQ
jgi:hypothetical protein